MQRALDAVCVWCGSQSTADSRQPLLLRFRRVHCISKTFFQHNPIIVLYASIYVGTDCSVVCSSPENTLHSHVMPGGVGGLRPAIYRNLPQFYRNFSVMPLFKNFIFPLRKILSLPSLLLGTLYVYVFSSAQHVIYVAARFSVFVFPKCHPLLGTAIPALVKGQ